MLSAAVADREVSRSLSFAADAGVGSMVAAPGAGYARDVDVVDMERRS